MIGDKLNIKKEHIDAGQSLSDILLPKIEDSEGKFVITVAGESGAGKSEIAFTLSEKLLEKGVKSAILQQDDYFVYPPKTNADMRKKDIGHVGLSEVRLELLDQNLRDILDGKTEIEKPLVIYEEDRVTSEMIKVDTVKVIIVEGTYTTSLNNVQQHVFIDRTRMDTKESRKERAREEQDEYLERILEIEHDIISANKARADIIITRDYKAEVNDETEK